MAEKEKVFKVSDKGVLVSYPVGQKLEINGEICKVVKDKPYGEFCESCALYNADESGLTIRCEHLACTDYERPDGMNVHFERI